MHHKSGLVQGYVVDAAGGERGAVQGSKWPHACPLSSPARIPKNSQKMFFLPK